MQNIKIFDASGNTIAHGILGESVLSIEGNYYFDRENVQLDKLVKKQAMYTCPIKRSTCDYYYLQNEQGDAIEPEVAWIYEKIVNETFKLIEGKVGFYARSGRGLELVIT